MKILFDHQIYSNQNYGGISRYFYELSKGLVSLGNNCRHSIYFSENEFMKDTEVFNSRKFPPFKFRGRGSVKERLNRFVSGRFLQKGDYDIFHPTYYDPYFLSTKQSDRPFVVTFHDLIHEKFSDKYPTLLTSIDRVVSNRRTLLNMASKVIAISNNTKNDIVKYYGVAEDRIQVTHLASSFVNDSSAPDKDWGDYILFVGNRLAYKNFTTFLDGAHHLLRRAKTLKLICAGGGSFSDEEQKQIIKLGVKDKVIQLPIDDRLLMRLYSNALFFVFPSLYEGFGIPALEAFNCGCPAILSNVSSLPEIGLDVALFVDPENPQDILEKCEEFYYNPKLREEYREKGLTHAARFSWQKVSSQTLDIYRSAL